MHNKICHIFERLPDEKECIERLADESQEFKIICEDYEVCVKAFLHWSVSQAPEAAARTEEYRTLVQEVYEELVDVLKKFKP